MFGQAARQVILVVVWCALILRTPMVMRDRRQLPLWQVVAVFAASAIVMRDGFSVFVDAVAGDPEFHHLVANLWDVVSFSSPLYFAAKLTGRTRHRPFWVAWALVTAGVVIGTYVLAPRAFDADITSVPAVLFVAYLLGASLTTARLLHLHVAEVRDGILRLALWMIIVGEAVLVPYLVLAMCTSMSHGSAPWLMTIGQIGTVVRFTLLPLGCVLVTVEPVRKALVYRYQCWRLRGIWRLLRTATPRLRVVRTKPADAWEALHRRIVEIHDSVCHLYDTWATEDLVRAAHVYANDRATAVACWLEVTRRAAEEQAPPLYQVADLATLPDTLTGYEEMRWHLRIHRAMRSPATRWFADRYVPGPTEVARTSSSPLSSI